MPRPLDLKIHRRLRSGLEHHLYTGIQGHELERGVGQQRDKEAISASRRAAADISASIHGAAKDEQATEHRARRRESQTGDQERAEEGREVLEKVAVSSLGAVELERRRALGRLLFGRIRNRVLEAAILARQHG